jgi:DNA-binding transcriptional ArsR family regulator
MIDMSIGYKKVEKIVKGFANHWRIQILELLANNSHLSVDQITQNLGGNFMTISVHIKKLSDAGLVDKQYKGRFVLHNLTKRGRDILTFCKMLK